MSGWTNADAEAGADAIRGQLTLTDEDVQRAIREQAGLKWWHLGLVLPVILLMGWPAFKGWDSENPFVSVVPMLFFVVLMGFLLRVRFRTVGKQVMENKTEAERQLSFHFDASGYRITTPVSTASGQWSSVHRTQESASTFFIYPASNLFQVVPKRALAEPDVPRLRALLAEHVQPRPTKYTGTARAKKALLLWVALIFMFLLIWQFLGGEGSRGQSHPETDDTEEPSETETR
jgi:uncharacterized membrane protein